MINSFDTKFVKGRVKAAMSVSPNYDLAVRNTPAVRALRRKLQKPRENPARNEGLLCQDSPGGCRGAIEER